MVTMTLSNLRSLILSDKTNIAIKIVFYWILGANTTEKNTDVLNSLRWNIYFRRIQWSLSTSEIFIAGLEVFLHPSIFINLKKILNFQTDTCEDRIFLKNQESIPKQSILIVITYLEKT